MNKKHLNETITGSAVTIALLCVSWYGLSFGGSKFLEMSGFAGGLVGGSVAYFARKQEKQLEDRAEELGREANSGWLEFLKVIGSPIGGLLLALMARIVDSADAALILGATYMAASAIAIGFLTTRESFSKIKFGEN